VLEAIKLNHGTFIKEKAIMFSKANNAILRVKVLANMAKNVLTVLHEVGSLIEDGTLVLYCPNEKNNEKLEILKKKIADCFVDD